MNSYELSKGFFDWCYENPEKISPNHAAIYFFAIDHCNRLGWKEKFGFPTQMTMDAIGIKKHHTYSRYFNDLVEWGFFKLVQKSSNQYSSNIISLKSAMPKNGKALSKANKKHAAKQPESTGHGSGCIDKLLTLNLKTVEQYFDLFWSKYPNKISKQKAKGVFTKLTDTEIQTILNTIDSFVKYKPFPEYTHPHPTTYLNQKRWQDEIPTILPDQKKPQITRDVWFIARQIPAQKQKLCSQHQLTDQEFDNLYK